MRNGDDRTVEREQRVFQCFSGRDIEMVGRFVENEDIHLRQNQLCHGQTCLFTAGKNGNLFLNIVAAEQKQCKGIADFGLCQIFICRPQLFKYRIVLIEVLLFLIVIADSNIVAVFIIAAIRLNAIHDDLQECRFAAAVGTVDKNVIAFADHCRDIGKQRLAGIGFRETIEFENVIAGFAGFGKMQTNLVGGSHRTVELDHFVQLLLSAFRRDDVAFAVPALLLLNVRLNAGDFTLLVLIMLFLNFAVLDLLLQIRGVVAVVHGAALVLDFENPVGNFIKEITVVRNDENGFLVGLQMVFKPCQRVNIEMVGRLVEHQNIGFLQKQADECQSGLLTA